MPDRHGKEQDPFFPAREAEQRTRPKCLKTLTVTSSHNWPFPQASMKALVPKILGREIPASELHIGEISPDVADGCEWLRSTSAAG